MDFDRISAQSLIAFQHHMKTLSSHILTLMRETVFGENNDLAQKILLGILNYDLVSKLLKEFVDELESPNSYLRLRISLNCHLYSV